MAVESENKLRPLRLASRDIQLKWTLGLLAETLKTSKKRLRKAFKVIRSPKLEAEIIEKGKPKKRIFHYGFRAFSITKQGKTREILAPHPEAQTVFKIISAWLEKIVPAHQNAFGFVKKKNPKKAVQTFLGQKHFFSFDVADAFPSITIEMVEVALRRLKTTEAVTKTLAWLVTYYFQNQRRLPQGSSCSPAILNLVYKPMCEEIDRICKEHSLEWVVYADDFNFAGESISQEVKNELLAVPARYGFKIKNEKIRDNLGKTIPHILGLAIRDGKIHIRRRLKNKFRRIIYAAGTKGAYSENCVRGVIQNIGYIYGDNWPGWLLKVYLDYLLADKGG